MRKMRALGSSLVSTGRNLAKKIVKRSLECAKMAVGISGLFPLRKGAGTRPGTPVFSTSFKGSEFWRKIEWLRK